MIYVMSEMIQKPINLYDSNKTEHNKSISLKICYNVFDVMP